MLIQNRFPFEIRDNEPSANISTLRELSLPFPISVYGRVTFAQYVRFLEKSHREDSLLSFVSEYNVQNYQVKATINIQGERQSRLGERLIRSSLIKNDYSYLLKKVSDKGSSPVSWIDVKP